MWCVPKLNAEYIERMEDVLDVYARPYDPKEPIVCMDEKSKQLLDDARPPKPCAPGKPRRTDYEYIRGGTVNVFMTVEPKGGYRRAVVTARRTRTDFAYEIKRIIRLPRYKDARKIHIVLDNLNTHFEKSLIDTFGEKETAAIMRRIEFHHTPKHASWLNMAEIELSVMERQCTRKRMATAAILTEELSAWETRRNREYATIDWSFTKADARRKFKYADRTI
jgi:hypothetical protein